ncbi:MAG TPA: hypothetical protein VF937_12820 [Chloroflexota bacterium]
MMLVLGALLTMVAPQAVQADPFSAWTPGPDASLDNTYDGYIDAPGMNATVPTGSFTVAGWFVDKTAEGWAGADDVQIWQGTMDGGGKLLTKANFAQSRPDVAAAEGNPYFAASGFGATLPPNALASGPQTLSVYAHTANKGWWYKQVQVNVSSATAAAPVSGAALPIVGIEKPKDSETVLTKSDYDIIGYALDKSAAPNQGVAGSGIDRVQVYLGAERENGGQYLGDAELGFSDSVATGLYGGQFASAGWRLTFKPTQFHANTYLLFAYARSAISGKEDFVVRYFAIREQQ